MAGFAEYLKEAREKAELNQSELAAKTGLTGSYISVLENRRKPPPSDRVLKNLARALGCPEQEMLEIAHLDRTPDDIRRKIRDLDRRLGLERRLTLRLLNDLIPSSLWHFWKVRGYQEYGLERVRLDAGKKSVLRKVLRRIGHLTTRDDFLERSREVIRSLPLEEQGVLAEVLPELVEGAPERDGDKPASGAQLAPLLAGPPPARGKSRETGLSFPISAEQLGTGAYFLTAPDESMAPLVQEDDLLLIDPGTQAGAGDLVVVRRKKAYIIRHLVEAPAGFLLAAADPRERAVSMKETEVRGVVIEIRRRLR